MNRNRNAWDRWHGSQAGNILANVSSRENLQRITCLRSRVNPACGPSFPGPWAWARYSAFISAKESRGFAGLTRFNLVKISELGKSPAYPLAGGAEILGNVRDLVQGRVPGNNGPRKPNRDILRPSIRQAWVFLHDRPKVRQKGSKSGPGGRSEPQAARVPGARVQGGAL